MSGDVLPERLSLLTDRRCGVCGGRLRALRRTAGWRGANPLVGEPTYVCPQCDAPAELPSRE